MTTLGGRLERRDAMAFAGRQEEIGAIEAVLAGEGEARVAFVHGPGGIGKSALAREAARRASRAGFSVHWVDGRELAPIPDAIEDALADTRRAKRPLLVLDSYERVAAIGGYLRRAALPVLSDRAAVLIASRRPPERGWSEEGWDSLVIEIDLSPIDPGAAAALLRSQGVTDAGTVSETIAWAAGSPLALTLAAGVGRETPGWRPGRELEPPALVGALIRRLTELDAYGPHLETLGTAAIARVTTPSLLRATLGESDAEAQYAWLASQSFVEQVGGGLALHELVRRAVRADLRRREPFLERAQRRRIADHLYERATASGDLLPIIDLAYLAENPALRWGFSWDAASRFHVDNPRPGDEQAISARCEGEDLAPLWASSKTYFSRAPQHVSVARDDQERICGYSVAMSAAAVPAFADEDPIVAPRLGHAQHTANDEGVVIWRDAADLTGDAASGVIGLLGMAALLRAAPGNPRYAYLPINPRVPGGRAFAIAAGGRHVPDLDARVGDELVECFSIDWGPGGLLAAQREYIYRELGIEPPPRPHAGDRLDLDVVHHALRNLHAPAELARSELAEGSTVDERAAFARGLIRDAVERAFGTDASEALMREALARGYLDPAPTQEAAARELHLSRSAYFRRLKMARERLADYLAHRIPDDPGPV